MPPAYSPPRSLDLKTIPGFNYAPMIKHELSLKIEGFVFLRTHLSLANLQFNEMDLKVHRSILDQIGDKPIYKMADISFPGLTRSTDSLVEEIMRKPLSDLQYLEDKEAMRVKLFDDCIFMMKSIRIQKDILYGVSNDEDFDLLDILFKNIQNDEILYKYVVLPRYQKVALSI